MIKDSHPKPPVMDSAVRTTESLATHSNARFMDKAMQTATPDLSTGLTGANEYGLPAGTSIHTRTKKAELPATSLRNNPVPANIYRGLQDVHGIARLQDIDPENTKIKWRINESNLIKELLAPWDRHEVNTAIEKMIERLTPDNYPDLDADKSNSINPIASCAAKVALTAMINGGAKNKDQPDKYNYGANGHQLTGTDLNKILKLIKGATWQTEFCNECRGITHHQTDALFLPRDQFITKDLTDTSNSASDQKSSSTLIPDNTPVYILAQLKVSQKLNPIESSWLAIWRPEFGLKFVKSQHVGLMNDEDIEKYSQIQHSENACELKMTLTDRIAKTHNFERLAIGTPLPTYGNDPMMASRTIKERTVRKTQFTLQLSEAKMQEVPLNPLEEGNILDRQIQKVPIPLNNCNFFKQISDNILKYPADLVPVEENDNRSFAWGEGTIGPDGERGQDMSTFVRKVMLPFGLSLPRYSQDQVDKGQEIARNQADGHSLEANYQALLNYGKPGTFVSWGPGNIMICLGSVSVEELQTLDRQAADDAGKFGLQQQTDQVPLLALSPIALTKRGESGMLFHHAGKTAVYPVFKDGCHSTFIQDERKLKFFRYFSDVDQK